MDWLWFRRNQNLFNRPMVGLAQLNPVMASYLLVLDLHYASADLNEFQLQPANRWANARSAGSVASISLYALMFSQTKHDFNFHGVTCFTHHYSIYFCSEWILFLRNNLAYRITIVVYPLFTPGLSLIESQSSFIPSPHLTSLFVLPRILRFPAQICWSFIVILPLLFFVSKQAHGAVSSNLLHQSLLKASNPLRKVRSTCFPWRIVLEFYAVSFNRAPKDLELNLANGMYTCPLLVL